MSLGLDDRARRAADNLKASVEQAPLLLASRTLNGSGRRRVAAVLRPVWIASVLILGSAVGFALVVEPTVIESTTSTTAIAEITTTATTDLTASTTTATNRSWRRLMPTPNLDRRAKNLSTSTTRWGNRDR